MRPKLIARIIMMAVNPSAVVALKSSGVICEPFASCRRPLAIRNRKTPGIMDTTEAKPMAANGMCQRRETGVRISPTKRHATKAPVAALAPSMASATHRSAWATMPTATGQASIYSGVEKKTVHILLDLLQIRLRPLDQKLAEVRAPVRHDGHGVRNITDDQRLVDIHLQVATS